LREYFDGAFMEGVGIWFYHLFRPDSDGIPQAQHFLATTRQFTNKARLAVDVESVVAPQRELTKAQYADELAAFVRTLRDATGELPVIYTSQGEWSKLVGTQHDALFAQCDLWVANYTSAATPALPRCWTSYLLWQYTSSGTVAGIQGRVDLNRWRGQKQPFVTPADFAYVISSRFNAPRNYDFAPTRKQLHEGLDFAPTAAAVAPYRVVAPADGKVVKVGYSERDYGHYIIIDHGDGVRSWLAHLAHAPLVSSGQVKQRDLVGFAGSTGATSTGIHLHWTMQQIPQGLDNYVVADVVDPEPFLKKAS
jgi:murein DD-endopeptidase MepM/ murein hydrolase activator NlpD